MQNINTGREKVTMQDIADELNISKVSVSKALGGKPGISEDLRQRVIAKAQEMGYGMPRTEPHYRIAFLVSKHFFLDTDNFYSEMYYYFNKRCLEQGHTATLMIVNGHDEQNDQLPFQLESGAYTGIAVAGEMPDHYLQAIAALNLPVVLLDFESPTLPFNAFLTDNYYWGRRVTRHLIEQGHHEIGFVGQPGSTNSITDRYFGYRRSLMDYGLTYHEEWLLVNNDPRTGLYQLSTNLPPILPTAFVCHCDMAAHYLITSLQSQGLRCPDDVAVVSFDNTPLAQTNEPPLTSVNIDITLFATIALDKLKSLMSHDPTPPERIYIPSSLVLRESSSRKL